MNNNRKGINLRSFSTEEELRDILVGVLRRKGIQPSLEIPFLGRSLDIAYRCADGSITTIEVKRQSKHVREALNQAKYCMLGADRVYVCMPNYGITENVKSAFRDLGVGLMFLKRKVDEYSVHYVLPAAPKIKKRKEYASLLRRSIFRNGNKL